MVGEGASMRRGRGWVRLVGKGGNGASMRSGRQIHRLVREDDSIGRMRGGGDTDLPEGRGWERVNGRLKKGKGRVNGRMKTKARISKLNSTKVSL